MSIFCIKKMLSHIPGDEFLLRRSVLRVFTKESRSAGGHLYPKRVHVLRFDNLQHNISTLAAGHGVDIFMDPT